VSTATTDAFSEVAAVAPFASVADSLVVLVVEADSKADESDAVAAAADAATDLAAATRLDFRLKKHTRVTLRSRTCSSVSKRRLQSDQILSSVPSEPDAA
jgi:hypothetical protein